LTEREKINPNFNEIILHCSATPEGKYFDVEDIKLWHLKDGIVLPKVLPSGYSNIGYHYLVLLDGTIQKGKPIEMMGAHCKDSGKNHSSIGICYIGGYAKDGKTPKDTRNPEQKKSLGRLLTNLLDAYPQLKTVSGHRKYAKKDCPCFEVSKEYEYLKGLFDVEVI